MANIQPKSSQINAHKTTRKAIYQQDLKLTRNQLSKTFFYL